jgi:hypothetical protein
MSNVAKVIANNTIRQHEHVVLIESFRVEYLIDARPEYHLELSLIKPNTFNILSLSFSTNESHFGNRFYEKLATFICAQLDDGMVKINQHEKLTINQGYTLVIGNNVKFLDMFKLQNMFEVSLDSGECKIQLY